ncbi:MAG: hypothetical protein ABI778_05550, partial [Ignavibacteriota bacterium]
MAIGFILLLLLASAFPVCAISQITVPLSSKASALSEFKELVLSGGSLSHEDSVLIALAQMKGLLRELPVLAGLGGKCGTELAIEATTIQNHFSKPLRDAVIASVTALTDSLKSPSGKFTIYYSKSG